MSVTSARACAQSRVQHSGNTNVVHVSAVSERQIAGLVLHSRRADAAGLNRENGAIQRDRLDGIEDLHVAGATTEIRTEMFGHVGLGQSITLLVDLTLGAHDDSGDAEPALESATRGECLGITIAFVLLHTFQRHDRFARDLLE
jgi:hypothetical protein